MARVKQQQQAQVTIIFFPFQLGHNWPLDAFGMFEQAVSLRKRSESKPWPSSFGFRVS